MEDINLLQRVIEDLTGLRGEIKKLQDSLREIKDIEDFSFDGFEEEQIKREEELEKRRQEIIKRKSLEELEELEQRRLERKRQEDEEIERKIQEIIKRKRQEEEEQRKIQELERNRREYRQKCFQCGGTGFREKYDYFSNTIERLFCYECNSLGYITWTYENCDCGHDKNCKICGGRGVITSHYP